MRKIGAEVVKAAGKGKGREADEARGGGEGKRQKKFLFELFLILF
jgi:hypothetical protein